jgi:hypothetical protein
MLMSALMRGARISLGVGGRRRSDGRIEAFALLLRESTFDDFLFTTTCLSHSSIRFAFVFQIPLLSVGF